MQSVGSAPVANPPMRKTMHSLSKSKPTAQPRAAPWADLIPDDQWSVFTSGIGAIERTGSPGLLAGAMALATYTQHWRNTKDVDVIVAPAAHEAAIAAVRKAGFEDYYDREAYDRSWIFRAWKDGVLFDIIWELPNHRVAIDDAWFERGVPVSVRGKVYHAAPPEELIRVKLYVMQRERCDWVDVLNVLAGSCEQLDGTWLVRRMGRDLPLLHAALAIFNWMCPRRARSIPDWLRQQFALPVGEEVDAQTEERRIRLFDSRPWFAMHQPLDRPLER